MVETTTSPTSAIHVLIAACNVHSDNTSLSTNSPPETPQSEVSGTETIDRRLKRSSSTTSSQSQPRGVNTSRDRMKQEIYHLRDTVEELQRQLDEIKRDHVRRSPRPKGPIAPSTAQLVAAWEAMARGQCEQRYRAEVENVKLRKMLDEQVKIAHTLERILTKRRNSEHWLNGQIISKRARTTEPGPLDHACVLMDMNAMLPSLYDQVDTVLARDCFAPSSAAFRHVNVLHSDDTGAYIEATEKRYVPFRHDAAGEAMWETFVFYPGHIFEDPIQHDEVLQDRIVREMETTVQLPRFSGRVRLKFTVRKFVEKDRTIIVWVALTDPSEITDAPLDGIFIRHTGWMCSRKSSLEVESTAMAEYLSAQLSVPEFLDTSIDRKRRMCTLTNYLVSSVTNHLDTIKQTLDNRLLERSLARATGVSSKVQRIEEQELKNECSS